MLKVSWSPYTHHVKSERVLIAKVKSMRLLYTVAAVSEIGMQACGLLLFPSSWSEEYADNLYEIDMQCKSCVWASLNIHSHYTLDIVHKHISFLVSGQ